jgi:hypothetical protein
MQLCSKSIELLEELTVQIEKVSQRIISIRKQKLSAMLRELENLATGFTSCLLLLSSPSTDRKIARLIDPPKNIDIMKAQAFSKFRKIGDSFDFFVRVDDIDVQIGGLRELLFCYKKLRSRAVTDLQILVSPSN